MAISKVFLKGKCKISAPYLKVKQLLSSNLLFSTKGLPVKEDEAKELIVIEPKSLVFMSGDIVLYINNDNIMDKKVGRVSLNTAFIPDNKTLVLKIDEVAPDTLKKSNSFDSGFELIIHFESICECPNRTPIESRCKICRSRLGSD